jgi:D-proline reductase (dithiol) PrdB
MTASGKIVDGFRFIPPALRELIRGEIPETPPVEQIPWTPLKKPIKEATFSLMTSAGISMRTDPPFDMEREKREPTWGDPSFREIPKEATEADINVNHLHIKTDYIKEDMNVILPLRRFRELENEGIIGELALTSYSYYGFQRDPTILLEQTMPKVARKMKEEGVEAILLTPA